MSPTCEHHDMIQAALERLQRTQDDGFRRTAEALEKLDGRVRALEQSEARAEGSNYNERLTALSGRTSDLERWRWKMVGLYTAVAAIAGFVASLLGKLI